MKACQEATAFNEATEADIEKIEPDPGMMQSVGEHREVPKGEAAAMPAGGLRKRRRDRNLAAERRQKPKERARGYCGSRKRATVAGRRITRCAGVAWLRRGDLRKDCTRAKVERAIRRVGPLRKNLRTHHDLGSKRPLYVRKKRATAIGIGGWR
jgi:Zn-finger nucleic acid-binding protein